MADSTAWTNTRVALKDFIKLLNCNKCEERPTDPIRYIDCQHLFCSSCVEQATTCLKCGIPVRPADIRPDHIAATIIAGCDEIAEIIFADGVETNENMDVVDDETNIEEFHNGSKIFTSTKIRKDLQKETVLKEKQSTTLVESDGSDKTEKMPSDDETKLNDSDELELPNTTNSVPSCIIPETSQSKKPSRSQKILTKKDSRKVPKIIDKRNKKGETLLHQACIKQQEEEVRFLLEHGANPNTKDNAHWTPLQEAVCYGLYNICEMLLEKGAVPDTPGVDNKTALHEAVIKNKYKEAALLLCYDANQNVFDNQGKKPIDYCTTEEMRKVLCQDNLLNETREKLGDMSLPLNRSIGSGMTKIVILACALSKSTSAALSQLTSKHKAKIVNAFVPSVTHVIIEVESDEHPFRKLTYDILLSILHGKWILSSNWIQMCLLPETKDLREVNLEIFEVKCITYEGTPTRARLNAEKQNPGLFNNCSFFFALNSSATYTVADISFTKKSLTRLVAEGGGTSLSREPNPEDATEVKQIPFHVAHDENNPLYNCSYYIIYSPGKEEPRVKYKMPHLKSLPLVWFIECIERFALVDPGLYGIDC
ncbi:BRCA1-associated RING domain protein 1-like isoform X2 [Belonocnema kinseyi]|uniref:BRCA1-associated RING domain protein 1-like isoform X2 n=1 Tax=Belonocnema kinseyi TaxID=2817044 RepID=UPI00143DB7C3|nr:BRCA1-associated RING domain protein 1-like isoform X2 [Belonocnema kinseyi]